MGQVFAFGNSHVSIFSGTDSMVPIWPNLSQDKLPWFRTFRIGAVTAYQAVKHMKLIYEICDSVSFKKDEDILLFVFGEVDIRAHIVEQSKKQNRPQVQITKEVVQRYFEAIKEAKDEGYEVAVFGCIAGFKLKEGGDKPPWPYSGTCKERNSITQIFNQELCKKCHTNYIPFISVFEEMLLMNGETDVRYLDINGAGCHLTTKILPLILWRFRDSGLIPFDCKLCEWESKGA